MTGSRAWSWPGGATWSGTFVAKTTAGGGGTLILTIAPGAANEMLLLGYHVGKNDYAANRTLIVEHEDVAGNVLAVLDSVAAIDNANLWGPTLRGADGTIVASTLEQIGVPYLPYIISGSDRIVFTTDTLAQNEELTVQIRCRLLGNIPSVTLTGSGTESLTTEESVVI